MTLTDTAYAKLNLALHVRGKLPDGRHAIETIFAFCEDGDRLSAEPGEEIQMTIDGPFAQGLATDADNLVLKAAIALQAAAGIDAGARIHLTKVLPVASGIGGGSADAAATLRLLSRMWGVDQAVAAEIAPRLGSDVPACLLAQPCFGTGGGEQLDALDPAKLSGAPVLVVNPRLPLPTGPVFAGWDGVDRGPLGTWQDGRNDLEASATRLVPKIGDVLEWLRGQRGATFVRMSGSGASCFALFDDQSACEDSAAAVPPHWWHLATRLR